MSNPWRDKCMAYHRAHPELTYKQVLMKLGKKNSQKKHKMRGRGNPPENDPFGSFLGGLGKAALEILPELLL